MLGYQKLHCIQFRGTDRFTLFVTVSVKELFIQYIFDLFLHVFLQCGNNFYNMIQYKFTSLDFTVFSTASSILS